MQKLLLFIGLLCLITSAYSYKYTPTNRCIWHNNSCVSQCPEWLIEAKPNCNKSYWLAQRTCEHPQKLFVGVSCGFSRCDCPDPTVLDTDTGYCYDVDNCPTRHIL